MNWFNLRFSSYIPERRGYHTTFVHEGKVYVHGGYDIKEGSIEDLWFMDLEKMQACIERKLEESLEREGLEDNEMDILFGW